MQIQPHLVLQTIKDVNQSLVDDNLVETDRIGAGAFFWALPSKGYQSRQNLIDNITNHQQTLDKDIEEIEAKIQMEKNSRISNDGEREQMMKELEELRKDNQQVVAKLKLYEKCDPEKLKEINENKKKCHQGMVRWTDNLYEIENWIKKNNAAMTGEEIYQAFPILRDLDYLE
ncbi:UNKNOWN [Stylonychia lemnae]|uniref:Meiotic nuclear division protein 1 homolog n=1 Tax=Stylonychia lemnae TaxID=5949 RepID=A0A078AR96_STYLE|nr:UNKNOWN [Stylonychia lemnae]|eukprot:CDW84744.1 UNKNOWN [Stylonychia lemnae]